MPNKTFDLLNIFNSTVLQARENENIFKRYGFTTTFLRAAFGIYLFFNLSSIF